MLNTELYIVVARLRVIDQSIGYALSSGIGTAIVAAIGIVWFGEPTGTSKLLSLALLFWVWPGSISPGGLLKHSAGKDRCAAEKRRQRVSNDPGRDRGEIPAKSALGFEARAK